MLVKFIEILNFRKLKAVRIDFSEATTLFVGANNSGKTSAMVALGHFLVDHSRFTTNDFTLSNWIILNGFASKWHEQPDSSVPCMPTLADVAPQLPSLDLWLEVAADEIHYARHLIPTLDWNGGLLGVRLQFEPKDIELLCKEFCAATALAKTTKQTAEQAKAAGGTYTFALWPRDMRDFLDRNLPSMFTVRAYLLDPKQCRDPVHGVAAPQRLAAGHDPIDGNPFGRLIHVDEIAAQRGLSDSGGGRKDGDNSDQQRQRQGHRRLSEQLSSYYSKHLDPSEFPEPADLDALEAIEKAQQIFDDRLMTGFSAALSELQSLNYPGVTDPTLKIATKLTPTDGLNHSAAVQYELISATGDVITASLLLPEQYNGLGYQNLISMVFRLMSFRDAWMRVGKASKPSSEGDEKGHVRPPLHLVLIEEPEAHLHVQVQQVFVRQAYKVLRNHDDLGEQSTHRTQLLVSTHSSHVAHECRFSSLRYFRRVPATASHTVPTAVVVNLSEVFGTNDETERFIIRYLQATHCDLFFADAAIFVEGAAERMLIPHFIRKHFEDLHRCYVTLLEIRGSHAHRLRPLIERLGLTTLIISDIDSVETSGHHKATPPKRASDQLTGNATLKVWHPAKSKLDELLNLSDTEKIKTYVDPTFSVRVAYQIPIAVNTTPSAAATEILATTFEDALAYENLNLFQTIDGNGMIEDFKTAITEHSTPAALQASCFEIVRTGDKAAFALDILSLDLPSAPVNTQTALVEHLKVPKYIYDGLSWLQDQLRPASRDCVSPNSTSALAAAPQEA